jgi:hypothetical protein
VCDSTGLADDHASRKVLFRGGRAELRATSELLQLEFHVDVPPSLRASARRRYELARAGYVSSELHPCAAALKPSVPVPSITAVIVGSDVHVRESIALLLRLHRQ